MSLLFVRALCLKSFLKHLMQRDEKTEAHPTCVVGGLRRTGRGNMERPMGLEPTPGPWQGPVLPLYYGRPKLQNFNTPTLPRQGPW